MAKVIREIYHDSGNSGDSGMGFVLGVILLIVFGVLFFVYGLPYLRGMQKNGGVQIKVPDTINVNVEQQPAQ